MKRRFLLCAALTAAVLLSAGLPATSFAEGNIWSSTTSRDSEGNICIDFEEVQVLLPASWSGKCQMSTSDTSVSFYQIKSRDLWTQELGYANGGWLFSINCAQNFDFLDNPNYLSIGTGSEGIYYASFPTDVQAYTDNEEAASEFFAMADDVEWIKENISLMASDISASITADYILPNSSTSYLTETDLDGLSADQVQMAINEIYARHHRKFVLPEVQEYFDSKSWYEGYIEADDFDVSTMNAYEGSNIDLLVKRLNTADTSAQSAQSQTSSQDAYGMIIESGDGYFRMRQEDGSVTQFWYDSEKLAEMGITEEALQAGAIASLIYDADSYEALSILVW